MTDCRFRIALALPFTLLLAAPLTQAAGAPTPPTVPAATTGAAPAGPQALYEQNCVKCHQSEVYTRPDRKITSLNALNAQVHRCEQMLSLGWFDEDVDAVTAYLNDRFYRFKP